MLSRLSVKKPYYIFVAAIIIIILGAVALMFMKTNLLPQTTVPYLMVITTDVGASPEQVEKDVSDVLEDKLSRVNGVTSINSTSAENYSMIFMEFEDGTNMDSALVKASAAINQVKSKLPETAGDPIFQELSLDMIASMYLAVSHDDKTYSQLTAYVKDTLIPALERQNGVASISNAGGVDNVLSIQLNQDKIDNVNGGVLGETNQKLADAKRGIDQGQAALNTAKNQIDEGQKELDNAKAQLDASKNSSANELANASLALNSALAAKMSYESQLTVLNIRKSMETDPIEIAKLDAEIAACQTAIQQISSQITGYSQFESSKIIGTLTFSSLETQLAVSQLQLQSASQTLDENQAKLDAGLDEYNAQAESARKASNIDKLVDINTLNQLIQAQNLEMPAGYVKDENSKSWIVKMGNKFETAEELESMVLTHIDGVGDITLNDVADVVNLNDEGDTYAKLNGKEGILLSVFKTPSANTGDVSKSVHKAYEDLMQDEKGLYITPIVDQAQYIDLYISTILQSLFLGAILALIVLIIFLRKVRPTIVVAFSIPFSVLFALVLMYFANIELNIMTLGAISLAIGMIVDNSIVVMENIYRLLGLGASPTKAAAQGTRQVSGAVVASTLTSICVFLPLIFTEGTVRQLLVPFALSIAFVLIASLIVAVTVVPAISSKIFKSGETQKELNLFTKAKNAYAKGLHWSLSHKAIVLGVSLVLLVGSAIGAYMTGVVVFPTTYTNQLEFSLDIPEDMSKEKVYSIADEIGNVFINEEGIKDVGIMDNSAGVGQGLSQTTMSSADKDAAPKVMLIYANVDTSKVWTEGGVADLQKKLTEKANNFGITVQSLNSMEDMSSLMSSSASVGVYGVELDKVKEYATQVEDTMKSIEGYENIEMPREEQDQTLRITFDKDEVARCNTTVAQIYQQIAQNLQTSVESIKIGVGVDAQTVEIDKQYLDGVTKENIMDFEFSDNAGGTHALSDVAELDIEDALSSISKKDSSYMIQVNADIKDGYNESLLSRELSPKLQEIKLDKGYEIKLQGIDEEVEEMLRQMFMLLALGFVLVYLVMVAQFQSLKSPFIIIFTVPLAFTGGLLAAICTGQPLTVMSLLGLVILMGVIVNNGIVYIDYVNQLRIGGMARWAALEAAGKTRMRPILMTALTTILSVIALIVNPEIGSSMERGMAIVVAGGLIYGTFMTLFVEPIIYDIFCKKPMYPIVIGGDIDEAVDDAERFINEMGEDAREKYDWVPKHLRKKDSSNNEIGESASDDNEIGESASDDNENN
ncbi:MAG: efflux RND transporter permease subunit [Coriobacteriales bacterium]|nr:efflux RND transporter permease subunit [Coriobacteriales bacterium]